MPSLTIAEFIPLEKLKEHLKSLPLPNWDEPPHRYHYPTSPSGYYTCTERPFSQVGEFARVRGGQFHDHYGPRIVKRLNIEAETTSIMEARVKMDIECAGCKQKFFAFGGYFDLFFLEHKWLIDFKFSKSELNDDYHWQTSAYDWMITHGVREKDHEWVPNQGFEVKTRTICTIHPVTFEVQERNYELDPLEKVSTMALRHHCGKKHGANGYLCGYGCQWCECWTACKKTGRLSPEVLKYKEKVKAEVVDD
jgi:hypothetical protein